MRRAVLIFAVMVFSVFSLPKFALCDLTCAQVDIQKLQQMTLERVAFDANMNITNSPTDVGLEYVRVD